MAKLNESEMQFAFLFFHKFMELMKFHNPQINVPSTVAEGTPGVPYNGADLVIDEFFIQFKNANFLKKGGGKFKNQFSNSRYFYFETYNSKRTTGGQFDFLKEHARNESNKVWYVAPSFKSNLSPYNWFQQFINSNPNDIDDFSCTVDIKNINWNWPKKTSKHYISYEAASNFVYLHSQPTQLDKIPITKTVPIYPVTDIAIDSQKYKSLEKVKENLIQSINEFYGQIVPEEEVISLDTSLREVQRKLLVRNNTLWVPIVLTQANSRNLVINNILSS